MLLDTMATHFTLKPNLIIYQMLEIIGAYLSICPQTSVMTTIRDLYFRAMETVHILELAYTKVEVKTQQHLTKLGCATHTR